MLLRTVIKREVIYFLSLHPRHPSSGSNKMILYMALVAILAVALISGWALYNHIKEDKPKVGYSLV